MKFIAIGIFCLDILVGSILIISDLPRKDAAYASPASHSTLAAKYTTPLPAATR